jgi:hypothetical protein
LEIICTPRLIGNSGTPSSSDFSANQWSTLFP